MVVVLRDAVPRHVGYPPCFRGRCTRLLPHPKVMPEGLLLPPVPGPQELHPSPAARLPHAPILPSQRLDDLRELGVQGMLPRGDARDGVVEVRVPTAVLDFLPWRKEGGHRRLNGHREQPVLPVLRGIRGLSAPRRAPAPPPRPSGPPCRPGENPCMWPEGGEKRAGGENAKGAGQGGARGQGAHLEAHPQVLPHRQDLRRRDLRLRIPGGPALRPRLLRRGSPRFLRHPRPRPLFSSLGNTCSIA